MHPAAKRKGLQQHRAGLNAGGRPPHRRALHSNSDQRTNALKTFPPQGCAVVFAFAFVFAFASVLLLSFAPHPHRFVILSEALFSGAEGPASQEASSALNLRAPSLRLLSGARVGNHKPTPRSLLPLYLPLPFLLNPQSHAPPPSPRRRRTA